MNKYINIGNPPKPICRFRDNVDALSGFQYVEVKRYNSVANASKDVDGSRANIGRCANGFVKTACGYRWEWDDEKDE